MFDVLCSIVLCSMFYVLCSFLLNPAFTVCFNGSRGILLFISWGYLVLETFQRSIVQLFDSCMLLTCYFNSSLVYWLTWLQIELFLNFTNFSRSHFKHLLILAVSLSCFRLKLIVSGPSDGSPTRRNIFEKKKKTLKFCKNLCVFGVRGGARWNSKFLFLWIVP